MASNREPHAVPPPATRNLRRVSITRHAHAARRRGNPGNRARTSPLQQHPRAAPTPPMPKARRSLHPLSRAPIHTAMHRATIVRGRATIKPPMSAMSASPRVELRPSKQSNPASMEGFRQHPQRRARRVYDSTHNATRRPIEGFRRHPQRHARRVCDSTHNATRRPAHRPVIGAVDPSAKMSPRVTLCIGAAIQHILNLPPHPHVSCAAAHRPRACATTFPRPGTRPCRQCPSNHPPAAKPPGDPSRSPSPPVADAVAAPVPPSAASCPGRVLRPHPRHTQ